MNFNTVLKKRKNTNKSLQIFYTEKNSSKNHTSNNNFTDPQNTTKLGSDDSILSQHDSFQSAMKITFITGQIVSLDSCIGFYMKDISRKRLTYFWLRYLYSILVCLYQVLATFLCFYDVLLGNLHLHKLAAICYYISKFFTCLLFIRLVPRWPQLMQHLSDSGLNEYVDPNIHIKCYVVSIIFIMAAFMDYLLSTVAIVTNTLDCLVEGDVYEIYIKDNFVWIFSTGIPYHLVFGIFLQIISTISALIWNYSDLFVMCISLYLSSILNQINKKILKVDGRALPASFWKSLREDYCNATCLVQIFDEAINGIVFSAFANNLLFLCLQLYYMMTHGLQAKRQMSDEECPNYPSGPFNGYEHVIYFTYAFMFSFGRSLALCLITAKVNVSSMAAAPTLFNVPSSAYCEEVQRLIEHVYGDTVALTGMNFFYVTRPLLITIAGTIITYELVLIQINVLAKHQISSLVKNPTRKNSCDSVCIDLPNDDVEPVCMMLSRYKRGYQYFVNMCHARRAICGQNLVMHIVHPSRCMKSGQFFMPFT